MRTKYLLIAATLFLTGCLSSLGPVSDTTPLRKDVHWHVDAKVAAPFGHDAITIANHVYFNDKCPSAILIAHEYKHVEQWYKYDITFPVVYVAHKGRLEKEATEYAAANFRRFESIQRAICRT